MSLDLAPFLISIFIFLNTYFISLFIFRDQAQPIDIQRLQEIVATWVVRPLSEVDDVNNTHVTDHQGFCKLQPKLKTKMKKEKK